MDGALLSALTLAAGSDHKVIDSEHPWEEVPAWQHVSQSGSHDSGGGGGGGEGASTVGGSVEHPGQDGHKSKGGGGGIEYARAG